MKAWVLIIIEILGASVAMIIWGEIFETIVPGYWGIVKWLAFIGYFVATCLIVGYIATKFRKKK